MIISLPPQSSILELGCGPGYLWSRNADRIPEQWQITLFDFSPGKLQAELAPWFSSVNIYRYEDALVVKEAKPLIADILSTPIATLFNDESIQHAVNIVQHEIDEKGAIHISKASGLFEADVA